jgi:hypothetical protein
VVKKKRRAGASNVYTFTDISEWTPHGATTGIPEWHAVMQAEDLPDAPHCPEASGVVLREEAVM